MHSWEDVQKRKIELQQEIVRGLDEPEKEILGHVIKLESENRHLRTPDVQKKIKNFIQQVIR